MGDLDIPIMLMAGDDDEPALGPHLPRRMIYDRAGSPRYYAVLKDATHFAFTNRVCGDTPLYLAAESNPQAGAICRYGYNFFQDYLLGDSSTLANLEEPDAAFTYYIMEPEPGEVLQWGEEPPPGGGGPGGIRDEFRPV